jgi:hypothetical protein
VQDRLSHSGPAFEQTPLFKAAHHGASGLVGLSGEQCQRMSGRIRHAGDGMQHAPLRQRHPHASQFGLAGHLLA